MSSRPLSNTDNKRIKRLDYPVSNEEITLLNYIRCRRKSKRCQESGVLVKLRISRRKIDWQEEK